MSKDIYIDNEFVESINVDDYIIEETIMIKGDDSVEGQIAVTRKGNKYFLELSTWGGTKKLGISKQFYDSCLEEFQNKRKESVFYND